MAVSLLMLVELVQLVVWQYARASIRSALDESAQIAVLQGPDACETHARQVLDEILGGPLGDDVTIACALAGVEATARADVTLHGWIAATPDWQFTLQAGAGIEPAPQPPAAP